MRYLDLLLFLPFCACSSTLHSPITGKKLAHFGADADLIEYSGGGVTCKIVNHRPSRTIKATGNAVNKSLMTGAGALMGGLVVP